MAFQRRGNLAPADRLATPHYNLCMSAWLKNLERLDESLRQPIRDYATRLKDLTGDHLLGLAICGAASAGTFDPAQLVQ